MDAESTGIWDSKVNVPPSYEDDPDVQDFIQVAPEEKEEKRQMEEGCKAFMQEKIEEIASLFVDFIPKTGLKLEELPKKFPELIKRVKYWHPLIIGPGLKKEGELKDRGEEWLRSAEYTKGELSRANQELSGRITAFQETQPAFKSAKQFCNESYTLYHEVKNTFSGLERSYQEMTQQLHFRIQIGGHSLTEKEQLYLTKLFDSSQKEIQSHLHDFSKKMPQFSRQKESIEKKWKEIKQEETSFKDNHDLFCFLIRGKTYLKTFQKVDFWAWRNSYRFIEETTAPFPSEVETTTHKKNIPKIQVSPLSVALVPADSNDKEFETVRLSTRRTQRDEIQSEATTEEISEEELKQDQIKRYVEFFREEKRLTSAIKLCIALSAKIRVRANRYLFCFDQIRMVASSCSSFPKTPLSLKEEQLSEEAKDLISRIGSVSNLFKRCTQELEGPSNTKRPDDESSEGTLQTIGKILLKSKLSYEKQSSTLIVLSQIKNRIIRKLEKRVKSDEKLNLSFHTGQLIGTIYLIPQDKLEKYQKNYHDFTQKCTEQMKKIAESYDQMNKDLTSFKYAFETLCHKVNTEFSTGMITRIGINLSNWWNGAQFIHQEDLRLKKIDFSLISLEKEEGEEQDVLVQEGKKSTGAVDGGEESDDG